MPHISSLDWKTHTHIGLDLDETLASTMPGMLEEAHSMGRLLQIKSIEDIYSYSLSLIDPTLSESDGQKIWESYGKKTLLPESVQVEVNATEGIKRLKSSRKNLSVVTARSDDLEWKKPRTIAWIRYHFPEIQDVYFVNHFSKDARPKSEICHEKSITLMVDDSIENARDLCEKGISMILLEKPWNKNDNWDHPLLYRVKGWQEIINSFGNNV